MRRKANTVYEDSDGVFDVGMDKENSGTLENHEKTNNATKGETESKSAQRKKKIYCFTTVSNPPGHPEPSNTASVNSDNSAKSQLWSWELSAFFIIILAYARNAPPR
jgi:hypothetical protein